MASNPPSDASLPLSSLPTRYVQSPSNTLPPLSCLPIPYGSNLPTSHGLRGSSNRGVMPKGPPTKPFDEEYHRWRKEEDFSGKQDGVNGAKGHRKCKQHRLANTVPLLDTPYEHRPSDTLFSSTLRPKETSSSSPASSIVPVQGPKSVAPIPSQFTLRPRQTPHGFRSSKTKNWKRPSNDGSIASRVVADEPDLADDEAKPSEVTGEDEDEDEVSSVVVEQDSDSTEDEDDPTDRYTSNGVDCDAAYGGASEKMGQEESRRWVEENCAPLPPG